MNCPSMIGMHSKCFVNPLEAGYVSVSRAAYQADFPAQAQMLAAMNPCPCGFLGPRFRTKIGTSTLCP
jgi:predicted ATPase with chaperone activity